MLALLAAVMLAAAPQHDTVFTADGGRVVGTVVEDSAQSVAIQLPDGTFRRLPRRDVVRIEYSDGSVSSRPSQAAPQPAPAQPPPPPAYRPPPPPPSYYPPPSYGRPMMHQPQPQWAAPVSTGPLEPFWLSLGVGGMFYGGNVEPGFSANGTFGPQMNLNFEGGLRLTPNLGLGLYADLGVGGPGTTATNECHAQGSDCSATTTRVGLLLRHTFAPYSRSTPWVAIGTGYAHGSVDFTDSFGNSANFYEYSGWEIARLMAGIDVRSNQVLGFGFYGGVGFTRFTDFTGLDATGVRFSTSISDPTIHTMFELGVRLTLFP